MRRSGKRLERNLIGSKLSSILNVNCLGQLSMTRKPRKFSGPRMRCHLKGFT
jgi:hypothetical protein